MKFAYVFKSSQPGIVRHASIQSGGSTSEIYSVNTFEQANDLAKDLVSQGIQSIELCGAFQEEGKQRIVDAIACDVPIGHVVYTNSYIECEQIDKDIERQPIVCPMEKALKLLQ